MQQGCSRAVPCGPGCLTFPSSWEEKKSKSFLEIICGHLGFHRLMALGSLQFFLEHSLALQVITLLTGLSPTGPFKRGPWKRVCTTRTMTTFLKLFLFVCFIKVLKLFPESRVLACAPSNSAADLILQRVMEHTVIPKSQTIRLNAFGRSILSLPKDIKVFLRY